MAKAIQTIGIDARFYGPIGKGLGRYTQEIVDHLVATDQAHRYVIFLSKHNYADFQADGIRVKKVLADVMWYGLKEQLVMPRLIKEQQVDLMHFPHFNVPLFCPVKFVVTIHDLILTKYPTVRATTLSPLFYHLKNLAYKLVIWRAVQGAQKIITVSEFTKADIIKYFQVKAERIVVTYEGIADLPGETNSVASPKQSQAQLAKLNITKPYLLYVGNAYPHKNLERLLLVTKKLLEHRDLQLVLVGKIDYFYQRLVDLVAKWSAKDRSRVVFTGFVNDEQLNLLYTQALVYVFPSLYEGFGLPPLEAMAKNCPVASSNRSSMPEILGQAALYFDPENDQELLRQLDRFIIDVPLRQAMIRRGKEQIKRYDWSSCARATLQVYQNIL